ncbi:hypothetical protein GCM10009114_28910 [Aliiglaciecola litoralis]|uniref:Solute-binding protein family 3/N-terminal domain-containing protein n=2 Tax=Aliiglaciecola litoralis TaxID=582857 RepID=A0ABN1LPA9_9ALTE
MLSLTFILFSLTAHAVTPDKVSIAVLHIEDVLEAKRDDLPYVNILRILDQRIPIQFEYQFVHALRVKETFDPKNNMACLFPNSILAKDFGRPLIESSPILIAKAYFIAKHPLTSEAIVNPDHPPLQLGYRYGNTFGGKIRLLSHHKLIPLNSGADIRNLIERDRIDAFLGYLPDSFAIINKLPDKPLVYTEASLFHSQRDSFLCQDTPDNQILMTLINNEIQKMIDSGELARILAPLKKTIPGQS